MSNFIINDIKDIFRKGNMLNRIILINIILFVILVLIKLFFFPYFQSILKQISISGNLMTFVYKPWTLLTYMFVHVELYHLIVNLLVYYWFGNILGDLIGDKKIFPIYLLGGLSGGLFFLVYSYLIGTNTLLMGASAGIMATVGAAAFLAPNYQFNLILIGKTPLKYIAIAYVIIDLAMISNQHNVGGHIAHIGGLIMGVLFIYLLKNGTDLSIIINKYSQILVSLFKSEQKTKLVVLHKNVKNKKNQLSKTSQHELDKILEKVKKKGYDNLTKEEKEALFIASKNNNA